MSESKLATTVEEKTNLQEKVKEVKEQMQEASNLLIEDFEETKTSTEEVDSGRRDILKLREYYKPFEYPQFFEYFKLQQQAHWLPTEVPMADDLVDFKSKFLVLFNTLNSTWVI